MSKIYGNTMADLGRAALGSVMLGAFAGVCFGVSFYHDGRLAKDWPTAVVGALVIGVMVPLVVLPSCFFSIRVDEQHISHLFCRQFVLKQRPLSQLVSVQVGRGLFAVVFRFSDGSHIRFWGARIRVIDAMCGHIRKLLPDFHAFTFGRRYALLARSIHKLNSKQN